MAALRTEVSVHHLLTVATYFSLVFVLHTEVRDLVFSGDACKNRAELVSRSADMTYDAAVTQRSIEHIWSLWEDRHNNILVPGHDLPMVLEDGEPEFSEPGIYSRFSPPSRPRQ